MSTRYDLRELCVLTSRAVGTLFGRFSLEALYKAPPPLRHMFQPRAASRPHTATMERPQPFMDSLQCTPPELAAAWARARARLAAREQEAHLGISTPQHAQPRAALPAAAQAAPAGAVHALLAHNAHTRSDSWSAAVLVRGGRGARRVASI